ncbi:hypothetical protein VM1G_00773 [Cytospora mali]|uniref:DUF7924 domain-containing protein n=1 Tax=Cytospora mali TaxID=578113 RepID=A0A194VKG9_CYTMA|nr:hypothetical protein VM1G_00773 [Valsa mali]
MAFRVRLGQPESRILRDGCGPQTRNLTLYPASCTIFLGARYITPPWTRIPNTASCVNIAEHLNRQSNEVYPVNSAAFSIAMSGSEARLYISWKQNELDYYMANIDSFLLQKPKDYLEFRKYVLNIIDWGNDTRLNEIRSCLDFLLEESRKKASEAAKARPPPSDSSLSSSKRGKASSRGRTGSMGSDAAQSGDANEYYWSLDATYGRWFHINEDGTIVWANQEGGQSSTMSL